MIHSITPFLWFDGRAEEAMRFYTSIFPNSSIDAVNPMSVTFHLQGQKFYGLNGGPLYAFTPAISLFVSVATQADIDGLWEALTEGGAAGRCGWLVDKFGLSWQIVPTALGDLMSDDERSDYAVNAMMQMSKIVIEDLQPAELPTGAKPVVENTRSV